MIIQYNTNGGYFNGILFTRYPATGAASGPLGVYLTKYYFNNSIPNTSQSIVSLQGVDIGRPSRISINVGKNDQEITSVSIAGTSVIMGKGQLFL
ncbi:PhzF family phenazine biosynthesis protein [Clostridioides mangenotii]|nr:PhzF family phenazine biosynthesis protein [Clostridioides mangenotii]